MNFDDSPEDKAFRAEVRAWFDAHAATRQGPGDWSINQQAPDYAARCQSWQHTLYQGGWGALTWPEEYGGRGLSGWHQTMFNQEAAAYDVSVGVFSVGIGMCGPTLITHGTEEHKHRFLPPLIRGEEIWCQLFSEPDAGSDLASLKTRAERDGEVFMVNGQKVWSSGAHHSDWGILLARTDALAPKHKGITYFLLDMQTPGVEVRPLVQLTGHAHFNEVFLTDVLVPISCVVGEVNGGWGVAHTTMAHERALIGGTSGQATTVGALVDLARRCECASDVMIRQEIARAHSRIEVLRYLNLQIQTAVSQGNMVGPSASIMKLFLSRHLSLTGDLVMAITGAHGMLADSSALDEGRWQTVFLNQWASKIGGGTDQIQRNTIGERVLGLPAESRLDKDVPFVELVSSTPSPP